MQGEAVLRTQTSDVLVNTLAFSQVVRIINHFYPKDRHVEVDFAPSSGLNCSTKAGDFELHSCTHEVAVCSVKFGTIK